MKVKNINIRDLPILVVVYNIVHDSRLYGLNAREKGWRRVSREDRAGRKYLTDTGKHTTRVIRYSSTDKKDFSKFNEEVRQINYKKHPEIICTPDGFLWKFPNKPIISYSSKSEHFKTPSVEFDRIRASNQACHIAKVMKKLGYLNLKYGRRRKRENVPAEYPCEWRD